MKKQPAATLVFQSAKLALDTAHSDAVRAVINAEGVPYVELRSRVIDALGEKVSPRLPPEYLLLEGEKGPEVLRLLEPMLHARIEGEQRFFADAAIDTNVYVGKGKGYRISAEGKGKPIFSDQQVVPNYLTGTGKVLTHMRWLEPHRDLQHARRYDVIIGSVVLAVDGALPTYDRERG